VLVCLFAGVPKCIILVGILWAIVQLGAALVTAWDVQWDAVLAASPRYRKFYDHG
jgi:hypothetical protein